ncbi:MAG: putative Ig domain-containing protein [Oligoflexia bacterium]|nr:putative Ig domain-containing protein [Oligoflexia bacterium]
MSIKYNKNIMPFFGVVISIVLLFLVLNGCHLLDDEKPTDENNIEGNNKNNNSESTGTTEAPVIEITTPSPSSGSENGNRNSNGNNGNNGNSTTEHPDPSVVITPKPIPIPIKFHYPYEKYDLYVGVWFGDIIPKIESGSIKKFLMDTNSTLPLGLTLDTSTGIVSGVPKFPKKYLNEIKVFNVTVNAIDKNEQVADKVTVTFTLKSINVGDISAGKDYLCALAKENPFESDISLGVLCWGNLSILSDKVSIPHFIYLSDKKENFDRIEINDNQICLKTWSEIKCKTHKDKNFTPMLSLDPDSYSEITIGLEHACAIENKKKVKCWGNNNLGQLGTNPQTLKKSSQPISVLDSGKDISDISSGNNHTCILDSESKIYCWGDNSLGQLGVSGTQYGLVLVPKISQGKILTFKSKENYNCIIDMSDKVFCWGEMHLNGVKNIFPPIEIKGIPPSAYALDLGTEKACASDSNNIYCWGNTNQGIEKTSISNEKSFKLQIGKEFMCANYGLGLNTVLCWGKNDKGQLGVGPELKYSANPIPPLPWIIEQI